MSIDYTDWSRDTLERGMIAVWHYANGLKHAKSKPVAGANKARFDFEADAIEHLIAFCEWNVSEMGLPSDFEQHRHMKG